MIVIVIVVVAVVVIIFSAPEIRIPSACPATSTAARRMQRA
jgi:hypothetical protein